MTNSSLNATRIELLADIIRKKLKGTKKGHCARVDYLGRGEALAICDNIAKQGLDDHVMARVLVPKTSADQLGDYDLTTDQAIELRNRKETSLCLFIPSDLVDAAESSIQNSFAAIDGRKLHNTVHKQLRKQLSREAQQIISAVVNLLTRHMKVGEEQQLDLVCAIAERDKDHRLDRAGLELWRVGLIADAGEDFTTRLEKNRRCVMSLRRPTKMQATANERIQSIRVSSETATRLRVFFSNRSMNDVVAWSALLDQEGLTFDQWIFPEEERSDLREVTVKSFVDASGKVLKTCKLRQMEGIGGPLIAVCGDKEKIVVKWETQPTTPKNLDRWLVQMVPVGGDTGEERADFFERQIDGKKRTLNIPLKIDPVGDSRDSNVCIRITPLDVSGNEILDDESGEPVHAESDEFFLSWDETPPVTTARETRATFPTIAYGRLEAAVNERAQSIGETRPQWTYKEGTDYFGVRINERRQVTVGVSRMLAWLERRVLDSPKSGGRFILTVHDVQSLDPDDEAIPEMLVSHPVSSEYSHAAWTAFWRDRKRFFDALKHSSPRDLIVVADWSEELANSAIRYAQSYGKLIDELVTRGSGEEELLAAMTVDTLLVRWGRGCTAEEAIVILPTAPIRAAWFAGYTRLLAHWEQHILGLATPANRKQAIDLDTVKLLAPTNAPPFAYHLENGEAFIFFQNLSFAYGVALPPNVPDPRRRFSDIATLLGVSSEQRQTSPLQPQRLAEHIRNFAAIHPLADTLVTTLINPDRGDFFVEALRHLRQVDRTDDLDGEETDSIPRFHLIAYMEYEHQNNGQMLEQLRRLQLEHRFRDSDHFVPAIAASLRLMDDLEKHDLPLPDAHLAIATDMTRPDVVVVAPSDNSEASSFSLYGLMARFISQFVADHHGFFWHYRIIPESPANPEPHPAGVRYSDTLLDLHRSMLNGGGRLLNEHGHFHPGLEVTLRRDDQALLERLHGSADWIITLDRFFLLDYYDSPNVPSLKAMSQKYLLDYTPEFAEGIGHRMMVTTAWRDEINLVLARAMHDLGISSIESSVSQVLHMLKTVSGRLALQALDSSSSAAAAVGLGIVTTWLQRQGQLSQAILIPVDPHPTLFRHSSAKGKINIGERRCDLVLIALKRNIVEATFIEVKWRRGRVPIDQLASDMVLQMESTEAAFRDRFFNSNRLDGALHRGYLAVVLRFYLERSRRYGMIDDATVQTFLAHLTRLEKSGVDTEEKPEKGGLRLRTFFKGYIVSLDELPRKSINVNGAEIILLTARDFEASLDIFPSNETPDDDAWPIPPPDTLNVSTNGTATSLQIAETLPAPDVESLDGPASTISQPTPPRIEKLPSENVVVPLEESATTSRPAPPRMEKLPSENVVVPLGDSAHGQVDWCPSVKGSPHLFVIGIPGQGKSWAVTRMLCLLGQQHVPSLVLDFHGQFADPTEPFMQTVGPTVIDASAGLPFSPFEYAAGDNSGDWKANSYAIAEIFGYVAGLGDMQRDIVSQAIAEAYRNRGFDMDVPAEERGYPTISEVFRNIQRREQGSRVANVTARCRPLLEMDLFRPTDGGPDLLSSVQRGLVIDLHNLYIEMLQVAAGAFILRKIYKDMFRWGVAERLRLVIVLDEAHRLARDVTLPKIMKEGRKFGIAVVVASQGMSDFHPDILGNAGTKVLFRVNYPESRKLAGFIRARQGEDLAARIEQLTVGSAYVQTPAMKQGDVVRMYPLEK